MISRYTTTRAAILLSILFVFYSAVDCPAQSTPQYSAGTNGIPSIEQAQDADTDLWGEAALKQPGGPSYEFFAKLIPPLRYVDANFLQYPIVLSAPSNPTKSRLISNGSCVNALARQPSWHGEIGTPVTFYVGDSREMFGSNLARLDGPKYADGYLPIVQLSYQAAGATYGEEAFASTDPALADNGAVLVRLTLTVASGRKYKSKPAHDKDPAATAPVAGVEGAENLRLIAKDFDEKIEASIEGSESYKLQDNRLITADGKVVAMIYPRWITNPGRNALVAPLKTGESAYILIFAKPADASAIQFKLDPQSYDAQRQACAKTWNDLLNQGTVIETPEAVVNNAWRATVIGNYMLLSGDEMRYSAGNQYAKLYIGEGGDTIRAMSLFGHTADAKRMMPPQFAYTRKGLEFHQAAFKLQMLANYYALTHDADFVRSIRSSWQKEIDVIVKGRQTDNGMFPREKYCGDIDTRVFSLNSNSNCWRALRDMSIMLADLGETEPAQKLASIASDYRKIILAAIDKATQRDVDPPFVPIALSGEEHPHDPIWGTTIGSYWNLMIEYVLGSGVFTPDSQSATDILHYLQAKSGLCMGMLRARATPGNFWTTGGRINDLYGTRYVLTLLRRDEADRALVSFYGKLAQGMTRDTFIGCEGSGMNPVDEFGRQMYLPPNSAGNANFLQQLRYLLVQDWDMDDDGRPETLRLCFATPRAWLADSKTIKVNKAPTAFGEVSFTIESHIGQGEVSATVELPSRHFDRALLRFRLPDGKKIASAMIDDQPAKLVDGETVELAGNGTVKIRAKVTP